MAQNFECDVCHEVAADFMISVVHDGSVVCVGVECLLDWAMPIVEAYQEAIERDQGAQAEPEHVERKVDEATGEIIESRPEAPPVGEGGGVEGWEEGYPQRGKRRGKSAGDGDGATVGASSEGAPPADGDG